MLFFRYLQKKYFEKVPISAIVFGFLGYRAKQQCFLHILERNKENEY